MADCSIERTRVGKRRPWLSLGVICSVVFGGVFSVEAAIAATQNIYPAPLVTDDAVPNGAVSLDVMYDVSDADATLTGIGVRVHYDSSKLSFDQVNETLAFGRFFDPTLVTSEADSKDFDADGATDRFISLAWVDFAGNWPGTLPEKLAAVHFVAAGDFAGSTVVRFTASDLAAGYEFISTPATVNEANEHLLTVTRSGTGSGTVTSSPTGIDCGSDCSEVYIEGTQVNLTATASAGSQFVGWSGDCTGLDSPYKVTMDTARTCNAIFDLDTWELSITKSGTGSGTVTSSPLGIDCGIDCNETYNEGTQVNLAATPGDGSVFVGWGGSCSGAEPSVKVTMDADKTCDAVFDLVTWQLTVTKSGSGSGTITSNPSGIDCGNDCNETYDHGTLVELVATPDEGSEFVSWAGACAGTVSPVGVTMDADKVCDAVFNTIPITWELSVTKSGTGSGTVTSSLSGIDCGSDCSEIYNDGAQVTLIATPDAGSEFVNWEGACTGSDSPIAVTMDADKTCNAVFDLVSWELSVTKSGTGAGTVTSSPAGIDCGDDCSGSYDDGTLVELTATPTSGDLFNGWSGDCSGTDAVTSVTMDGAKTCDAEFTSDPTLAQEIYPNPQAMTVFPDEAVSLEVMYDTPSEDATLTGIGIRIHYDSSKLSFDQVNETLAFGRQFDPALVVSEEDTSDYDSDTATDRYIALTWEDAGEAWPGSLPEKLATVHFMAAGDFALSTTVRFSASSLATNYGFSSKAASIQAEIIFADSLE